MQYILPSHCEICMYYGDCSPFPYVYAGIVRGIPLYLSTQKGHFSEQKTMIYT